jgi:hypothetical protein
MGRSPVHSDDICHIYTWPGRVMRDGTKSINSMAVGKFAKAFLPLIGSAWLAFLAPKDSTGLTNVAYVVTGYAAGYFAVSLSMMVLFAIPFLSYKIHWSGSAIELDHVPFLVHLALTSECAHQVNDLRCEVTDPEGRRAVASPNIGNNAGSGVVVRGEPVWVDYPHNFIKTICNPGRYEIRWTSATRNGKKRVTVCKGNFVVTP